MLLRLGAVSAGEQALRRQLKEGQSDPEDRRSQASVTRRVRAAKRVWESEEGYSDRGCLE